jgi:hypothetical protein
MVSAGTVSIVFIYETIVRACLVPKIFSKIFKFPVTSIFGHMHEALNVAKK